MNAGKMMQWGECLACGGPFALDSRGNLPPHTLTAHEHTPCGGIGLPPADGNLDDATRREALPHYLAAVNAAEVGRQKAEGSDPDSPRMAYTAAVGYYGDRIAHAEALAALYRQVVVSGDWWAVIGKAFRSLAEPGFPAGHLAQWQAQQERAAARSFLRAVRSRFLGRLDEGRPAEVALLEVWFHL